MNWLPASTRFILHNVSRHGAGRHRQRVPRDRSPQRARIGSWQLNPGCSLHIKIPEVLAVGNRRRNDRVRRTVGKLSGRVAQAEEGRQDVIAVLVYDYTVVSVLGRLQTSVNGTNLIG